MAKEELREEMEQIEKDLAFIKEHDPKGYEDIKYFIENAKKLRANKPEVFKNLLEVIRTVVEKGTN